MSSRVLLGFSNCELYTYLYKVSIHTFHFSQRNHQYQEITTKITMASSNSEGVSDQAECEHASCACNNQKVRNSVIKIYGANGFLLRECIYRSWQISRVLPTKFVRKILYIHPHSYRTMLSLARTGCGGCVS